MYLLLYHYNKNKPFKFIKFWYFQLWVRCSEACRIAGSAQDSQTISYLRKAHDSCLR